MAFSLYAHEAVGGIHCMTPPRVGKETRLPDMPCQVPCNCITCCTAGRSRNGVNISTGVPPSSSVYLALVKLNEFWHGILIRSLLGGQVWLLPCGCEVFFMGLQFWRLARGRRLRPGWWALLCCWAWLRWRAAAQTRARERLRRPCPVSDSASHERVILAYVAPQLFQQACP